MKNLKKLLAVILVAAMVLGVGALSASAAFTDTANSPYQEAIDVLSGIGVINGTSPTTYEPNGTLDRASAAKVITYLLLGTTNAALISQASSQTFSDVPTTHWASGYIDYCASQGIIAGTGDGTFNPSGTLTTLAFTKMLLVALGYNADIEGYVGSNWAINIASDALTAGVYDSNIPLTTNAVCSREQAAQLAFKALSARTVQYTGGSTITVGGTTITTGATMSFVPGSVGAGENYNGAVGDGFMQFCEKHFPSLKLTPTTTDSFGRPAHSWKNGSKLIGQYKDAPAVTYTAKKQAPAVAADLNGYKLYSATDSEWKNVENVTAYVTGSSAFATDTILKADGAAGAALTVDAAAPGRTVAAAIASLTADGKLVEIYADNNRNITAIITITYTVGKITNVVATSTKTTYSIGGSDYVDYVDDNLYVDTIDGASGMVKNDVITYVQHAVTNKMYVYPTTKVTGVATAYTVVHSVPSTITIGGTAYPIGNGVVNVATFAANPVESNYYLDQYGYAVATSAISAPSNYAFLAAKFGTLSTSIDGTVPTGQVKAVKTDGTVAVYDLKMKKLADGDALIGEESDNGVEFEAGDYIIAGTNICAYDADTYDASDVNTAVNTLGDVYAYTLSDNTITLISLEKAAGAGMTVGNVYFDTDVDDLGYGVTNKTGSTSATVLITNASVYVVYDSIFNTATVYTGNSGLPTTASAGSIDNTDVVLTATAAGAGTANYIFATVAGGFAPAVAPTYVYVDKDIVTSGVNPLGIPVYTYTGTKPDGTTLELTATGAVLTNSGIYTPNADNTIADANLKIKSTDVGIQNTYYLYDATLVVIGSLLEAGSDYYNITDDTKIVYANPALSTVNGNGGYVVLAPTPGGAASANVAAIFVTVD